MSTPRKQPAGQRSRHTETRRKVEEAAGALFVERGYEGTTMQAIADAAGVHVQTVYLAYGTKPAVLAATAARLVAGSDDPESHPSERPFAQAIMATADPGEKIRLYVRHIRDVTPRTVALIDVLRAAAPRTPRSRPSSHTCRTAAGKARLRCSPRSQRRAGCGPDSPSPSPPTSRMPSPAPRPSERSLTSAIGPGDAPSPGSPTRSSMLCSPSTRGVLVPVLVVTRVVHERSHPCVRGRGDGP